MMITRQPVMTEVPSMDLNAVHDKHADLFAPRFRGFECGNGWAGLIDEILTELRTACPNARIVQVKEKLGGLRIYLENKLDEEAKVILRRAELKSFTVCETCGAPGELRRTCGHVGVRCDQHWERRSGTSIN